MVYVTPSQSYESQAVINTVLEELLFIIRFILAEESHPKELVVTKRYTPDVVYVVPFQVYESQAVAEVEDTL
tara:strand:+ start:554 stop:769 length:216 start_codon:yes stop_codon:yes gene_type:complete